jgi:hypothetical protein
VGLNAFLFEKRVPDQQPLCDCGQARETVTHVITQCPNRARERFRLRERLGHDDVRRALSGKQAGVTAKWFMALGRITQFGLARRLQEEWGEENERRRRGPG